MNYRVAKITLSHGLFTGSPIGEHNVYKNPAGEIVREIRENNVKIRIIHCRGDGNMKLSISPNGGANWTINCTVDTLADWKTKFALIIDQATNI